MKRIALIFLFALLALPALAQQYQFTAPDCQFGFMYQVTGGVITSTSSASAQRLPTSNNQPGGTQTVTIGYDNRAQTCTTWTLMYQADSGVTPLSIELDQAPSNGDVPGSWTAFVQVAPGTVLPVTSVPTGNASVFGYEPWISANLNSATGTGRVYGRVLGWRPQAGQDVTSPGNAVVIAGFVYKHLAGAANNQIKATSGTLHTITLNGGATVGAVTVVDTSVAACTGGTTLAVITPVASTSPLTLTFDVATLNGLCIITAAANDVTVSYR